MGTLMRSPAGKSEPRRLPLPTRLATVAPPAAETPAAEQGNDVSQRQHDQVAQPRAADDAVMLDRVARAEARCIEVNAELDRLREDLAARQETAREAGYAQGVEQGIAQTQADMAERVMRLEDLLTALEDAHKDALKGREDDVVEAVLAATGKILGKKMVTRRGAAAAIRQACRQIDNRRKLVVRVAPDDLEILAADDVLGGALGGSARFEADSSVLLGGCVVETAGGTLDARLETQIESLRRVLLRAREKRAAEAAAQVGQPGKKAKK